MSKRSKTIANRRDEILTGAEAFAVASMRSGCECFVGYPAPFIVNIAEALNARCKLNNNKMAMLNMQTSEESISAVVGASWSGRKSMTAVYNLSSALDALGFAVTTETPCVIAVIESAGTSVGQSTQTTQSYMKVLREKNIEDKVIVFSPSSVSEVFKYTCKAFEYAYKYRVPVLILCDALLCNLYENFVTHSVSSTSQIVEKVQNTQMQEKSTRKIFGPVENGLCATMPLLGSGAQLTITAETHNDKGYREAVCSSTLEKSEKWLTDKIINEQEAIGEIVTQSVERVDIVLVCYGVQKRVCQDVIAIAKEKKISVGLIQLATLMPIPLQEIEKKLSKCLKVILVELNTGTLEQQLQKALKQKVIISVTKNNGNLILADEIMKFIEVKPGDKLNE